VSDIGTALNGFNLSSSGCPPGQPERKSDRRSADPASLPVFNGLVLGHLRPFENAVFPRDRTAEPASDANTTITQQNAF
jgi:hypothetical protein